MKKYQSFTYFVLIFFLFSCEQFDQIEGPVACMQLTRNTYEVGETLKLNNCSENAPISYFMVDGKTVDTKKIVYSYTFQEPGEFSIKLVAYNRTFRDEVSEIITVIPAGGSIVEVEVITEKVTRITSSTALISGIIRADEEVLTRGVVYGLGENVSLENNIGSVNSGTGAGEFEVELTGLSAETIYFARAFASVGDKFYYGSDLQFTTLFDGTVKSVAVGFTQKKPFVDGAVDALWDGVEAQIINTSMFGTDKVSYEREASFKALWDRTHVYVLIEVPDDDFYPALESGTEGWLSDKAEVYFDVNENIVDGGGPSTEDGTSNDGHFLFAPSYGEVDDSYDVSYGISSEEKNYFVEYAIPFTVLVDENGNVLNPVNRPTIGFDITLIDLDEAGKGETTEASQRVNWSNDGAIHESWTSLDYSGSFTFLEEASEPAPPSGNELVIFDPEDFMLEILPVGMSIITLGGEYFAQVIIQETDTYLGIDDVVGIEGYDLEVDMQHKLGPLSLEAGYGLNDIQNAVEVIDWDNETVYSWDEYGTPLHECYASFWQGNSTGQMETRYCYVSAPMDNAQELEMVAIINNVWTKAVGDTLLVGKITATKP